MLSRKNILWIDDDDELLRLQIEFLENNGYSVAAVHCGEDALALLRDPNCKSAFDLALIDRQTLAARCAPVIEEIRSVAQNLPLIMFTNIDNNADSAQFEKFGDSFQKPIEEKRLLHACRNAIDKARATPVSGALSRKYFSYHIDGMERMNSIANARNYMDFYEAQVKWAMEIDRAGDEGMRQAHAMMSFEYGRKFCEFIVENYANWANGSADKPLMSVDILDKAVVPELCDGKSVLMFVLSGAQLDKFIAMEKHIKNRFLVKGAKFMTTLPTASRFCMGALVCGLYGDALPNDIADESGNVSAVIMKRLMRDTLRDKGIKKVNAYYANAGSSSGNRSAKSIMTALKSELAFGVIAFDIAKKFFKGKCMFAPDEFSLRKEIETWFVSDILSMINDACADNCTVLLTADHGTMRCRRASVIYDAPEDALLSRCLFGDNVSIDERYAFLFNELAHFKLPRDAGSKCVMATGDTYFAPVENTIGKAGADVFQCGGISPQEMIMPIYLCKKSAGAK